MSAAGDKARINPVRSAEGKGVRVFFGTRPLRARSTKFARTIAYLSYGMLVYIPRSMAAYARRAASRTEQGSNRRIARSERHCYCHVKERLQ